MADTYDLQRFVDAQDNGSYETALQELRAGCKQSHWMWYIFPQIAGLGMSSMAQFYSISGLDEARAYLAHPLLGPRLRAVAQALLGGARGNTDPEAILGYIDAMKARSSMTLFQQAAPEEAVFAQVLETFYHGQPDAATLELLAAGA